MAAPTLSLTEAQELAALRSFLLGVLPPGVEVVRGQVNRVPEPQGSDFVVMTPLFQERLETNETSYGDTIVTGSISNSVFYVTAVVQNEGPIAVGATVIDTTGALAPNTVITALGAGTTGGVGNYTVSPAQIVASETMYVGVRADLVATQWTVQLDIHGPASGDNCRVIETLFRSEYGVDAVAAGGQDMTPLYCSGPRQVPFINAEQQYENRWCMDAVLQINPIVGTPQQFADQLKVGLVEIDASFPP